MAVWIRCTNFRTGVIHHDEWQSSCTRVNTADIFTGSLVQPEVYSRLYVAVGHHTMLEKLRGVQSHPRSLWKSYGGVVPTFRRGIFGQILVKFDGWSIYFRSWDFLLQVFTVSQLWTKACFFVVQLIKVTARAGPDFCSFLCSFSRNLCPYIFAYLGAAVCGGWRELAAEKIELFHWWTKWRGQKTNRAISFLWSTRGDLIVRSTWWTNFVWAEMYLWHRLALVGKQIYALKRSHK